MLGNYLKTDLQKYMPDFESAFKDFQNLIEELRERSETFNILSDGKNIKIGEIIKKTTSKLNSEMRS